MTLTLPRSSKFVETIAGAASHSAQGNAELAAFEVELAEISKGEAITSLSSQGFDTFTKRRPSSLCTLAVTAPVGYATSSEIVIELNSSI
eukprot:CAMPEP_0118935922 /NCGR_PEP_ID=MMETSP1169-20130426/15905_1 /TAXON_ID=36882 /ORGANISM="Pyramimonas obovata, Strain CCMP722" /LENGTH=89 /DNA_ID=CAMNT_0006879005 /DNA_START=1595 /DNA_END=1864 /DNA_ORIENTATION=-